jgi:predicted RND superfamily exporter protein
LERSGTGPAAAPIQPIMADLRALATAPDSTLMAVNASLTRFLPLQLGRLRVALDAHPTTASDIPADIARDWRLPDGRVRVQALSKPAARDSDGLHQFVAEVRSVAPNAAGPAVTIVETSGTITHAFITAAIGAVIAIAILLLIVLRRVLDVALVLAPLLLSALLTVIVAVLLPLPLNFANIIALPLLLGVGVSFNIYFVMNWRAGAQSYLGTATARAILFSALTTATAFGSLALSAHPGTASMGKLLLLSLGSTMLVTLLVMPPLLGALRPRV